MKRVYLDNAATTPLAPEVLQAMLPYLTEQFGNASAIYSYGREARLAIENARKKVANLLNATPGEIIFTSGGTESSNMAIEGAVRDLQCRHIITSKIEHHATLLTVLFLQEVYGLTVSYAKLIDNGHIDLNDVENLLETSKEKTLVTLMHANNEIGNMLDLSRLADICNQHNAILHSDTVQTLGHFKLDMNAISIQFLNGSGHKFHGPKGTGILYTKNTVQIKPMLHGGSQERNMRAGTENVAGIVGFAKSLELATQNMEADSKYIRSLKEYLKTKLLAMFPQIIFHGDIGEQSLYTVLNVGFPINEKTEMLSIGLDIAGICVSGGSACSSGSEKGSHVIRAIYPSQPSVPIRFSFSKHTTQNEIDITVQKISELL